MIPTKIPKGSPNSLKFYCWLRKSLEGLSHVGDVAWRGVGRHEALDEPQPDEGRCVGVVHLGSPVVNHVMIRAPFFGLV